MTTDETYKCSLSEASIEKAKKELNEDPKERLGAVKALREWINQEQWITAPTDTLWLLAVLRTKKFSQLASREFIETYWKVRSKYPDWYKGIEPCTDAHFESLRKSLSINRLLAYCKGGNFNIHIWALLGYFVCKGRETRCTYLVLPKRDSEGRTLILGRMSEIDVSGKSYDADEWVRTQFPVFEAMLINEEAQVNGYVMLIDCSGMTLQMQKFFGLERMTRNKDTNKALLGRVKQIHYYNVGPVFEALFAISRPFLTEKLKSRITMHGNTLVSVYKHIDRSLLPDEYLSEDYDGPRIGTCQQIIENYIQTTLMDPKVKAFLHDYYNSGYGVDMSKKPKENESMQASFRKLNVSL